MDASTHGGRRAGPGRSVPAAIAALLAASLLGPPAHARLPVALEGTPLPSLAPMLEQITPAVVNIAARGSVSVRAPRVLEEFFGSPLFRNERRRQVNSVGSGVIVDARRGHVVTNHHVIENTQQITVGLQDGRVLEAELVGTDAATDLAVLKVPARGLTAFRMADSDALRVGDFVVAIGNPFGLGQTVTSGIVSALGRSGLGIGGYEDFIQTDASINEGNSGGALVNLRGELVGINSVIFARGGGSIGIGFAIPSNMVRGVVAQLVRFGEVRRGLLGVAAQDLTPARATALGIAGREGALVARVQPGSEAEDAGLRQGDVITFFNGRAVRGAADLRNAIGLQQVGEAVRMRVLRNGRELRVSTRIGEKRLPAVEATDINERLVGALFSNIGKGSPLYGRIEGVLVREVERGSLAWGYGLRAGDVVVAANRQRVRDLGELKAVVGDRARPLVLNVARSSGSVFILVQ